MIKSLCEPGNPQKVGFDQNPTKDGERMRPILCLYGGFDKMFFMKHLILFSALACFGLGLIVLTRAIISFQSNRLRFQKDFIIAVSLLLYNLMPSFIFAYLEVNEPSVLEKAPWPGLRLGHSLQTPMVLGLIAFFTIRIVLQVQRESWKRQRLILFAGALLVPALFRILDSASVFPVAALWRGLLRSGALLFSLLVIYGSIITVAGRAQYHRFVHFTAVQAHYWKWTARTMVVLFSLTLLVDFHNNLLKTDSRVAGVLSIVPVFLFMVTFLLFQNRFAAVMYPRNDDDRSRDETFLALVGKYAITAREREIVLLICRGKTNNEIGKALFISMPTVKEHVSNIFRKTGVGNRVQLAALFHFQSDR
jgi:DNA-binding CsgD family transcriptional regulator